MGPRSGAGLPGIRDVEWEACLLEPRHDRELEREVRRAFGDVPSSVPYLSNSPWIVRSLVAINHYQVRLVHVDSVLGDLIGLVVSQDNSCRFCFATQRMLMRMQGFPEERIRQIEDDLLTAEILPRERLALQFARRISRASPLASGADKRPLREAGWTEDAIREIAFVAAAHVYFNRVVTLPAIPPQRMERMPDTWMMRLLAPYVRRVLRAHILRGAATPLPPDLRTGPFSPLVLALDGLPAAGALRRLLDAAFASPVLPLRTKALVMATIARGLVCPLSEREATGMLEQEGLSRPEIEQVLAHLGAPFLDPVEAAVVPFARETIRYRPAEIQRHGRALRDAMGREAFVELVGISALANAICRLGVVLPEA